MAAIHKNERAEESSLIRIVRSGILGKGLECDRGILFHKGNFSIIAPRSARFNVIQLLAEMREAGGDRVVLAIRERSQTEPAAENLK